MPKKPVKKKTTSWGEVAEWYDELLEGDEDSYQKKVILPNLLRLMGIEPGQRVAELACGQGFFARAFKEAGAVVTGADISPELIDLAKKKDPDIVWIVAPADEADAIADASQDRVAVILAIQNIERPADVFKEAARILKPGGSLHLVLNHPAFRIPKRSFWGWDDKKKVQYRRVDGYLSESKASIRMKPGSDPGSVTPSFHWPLQFFLKSLGRAGFGIMNGEEWSSHRTSDSGPRASEENRSRREIPLFLYLEARKLT